MINIRILTCLGLRTEQIDQTTSSRTHFGAFSTHGGTHITLPNAHFLAISLPNVTRQNSNLRTQQ